MKMEGNIYKKILIEKYDAFSLEENAIKKKLLQVEIQNILRDVTSPDTEDFYIWGLTFYSIDDETEKEINTNFALEKFLKAYQLDPNNFLACLYIAHCFQDKNDFNQALNYYEKVNQEDLKEFQIWRYVKLIEQIGYCHFKLGREEIGKKKFTEVLTWYKKTEFGQLAVPSELMECLDKSDQIVKEMLEIEDYLD